VPRVNVPRKPGHLGQAAFNDAKRQALRTALAGTPQQSFAATPTVSCVLPPSRTMIVFDAFRGSLRPFRRPAALYAGLQHGASLSGTVLDAYRASVQVFSHSTNSIFWPRLSDFSKQNSECGGIDRMSPRCEAILWIAGLHPVLDAQPVRGFRVTWRKRLHSRRLPNLLFHDLRRTAAQLAVHRRRRERHHEDRGLEDSLNTSKV
jgi:hypothetical protein